MLGGCQTSLSKRASTVTEAPAEAVGACEFVGPVFGTSQWGMNAAPTGIVNSKNEAREQAYQLGATHVVWQAEVGAWTSSVVGRAYKCVV